MIVYFWEKSKKTYIKWGIVIGVTLCELYMGFVLIKILHQSTQTIQVFKTETFFDNKIDISSSKDETSSQKPQTGEYAFVASKKGKYYYPKTCSKARALSIKNMLYFKDKMSAETAGFQAYLRCF